MSGVAFWRVDPSAVSPTLVSSVLVSESDPGRPPEVERLSISIVTCVVEGGWWVQVGVERPMSCCAATAAADTFLRLVNRFTRSERSERELERAERARPTGGERLGERPCTPQLAARVRVAFAVASSCRGFISSLLPLVDRGRAAGSSSPPADMLQLWSLMWSVVVCLATRKGEPEIRAEQVRGGEGAGT